MTFLEYIRSRSFKVFPFGPPLRRIGVSSQSPTGHDWATTEGPGEEGGVAGLVLGQKERAWIVGEQGGVYFRLGVTARHPQGKDLRWWQVW